LINRLPGVRPFRGPNKREGNTLSTYWGFVCRSHDPEIESEHWFNCGAALLADVYQKERAGEWPDDDGYEYGEPATINHDGYPPTTAPIIWLRAHPRCDVALRSEFGDTREIASA
jgi:hypothetical protein